jgi:hypothetical protein
MNRGVEIAAEVADSARSTIVEQVANGVSVRMAVLYLLLGGADPGGAEAGAGRGVRDRAGADRAGDDGWAGADRLSSEASEVAR